MIAQYCEAVNASGVRCRRGPRHRGHHLFARELQQEQAPAPEPTAALTRYPKLTKSLLAEGFRPPLAGHAGHAFEPLERLDPKLEVDAIAKILDLLVTLTPQGQERVMKVVSVYQGLLAVRSEPEREEHAGPNGGAP